MLTLFLILYIFSHTASSQRIIPVKDPYNITITFGSCNKYTGEDNNQIYYRIVETNPDVWIWLGDVAYLDQRIVPMFFVYSGDTKVKKMLTDAKNSIAYTHLRNNTPVIGIWDDHDYGLNNGGKHFKHKTYVKQEWLDYIDEPVDSPRRKQEGGIYDSYYIGGRDKVKVILLDVRYSKDEHSVLGGGDMLGEEQWQWLEDQLKDNEAALTLVGSGTQFLPDDRIFTETWYEESRARLLELFRKYKVKGLILLSGDVHYAEIMKYPCRDRMGFDLYEFTSSGLTHRAGETVPASDKVISAVFPDTYNTDEDRYYERNFGIIRLSFELDNPVVKLEVRNYYGIEVLNEELDYAKISFDEDILKEKADCELDVSVAGRLVEKSLESILLGNFYPLLIVVVMTYSMIAAIIVGWIIKKLFYKITGAPAKTRKLD